MTLSEAWAMSGGENKCPARKLCAFEDVQLLPDAIVETCVFCGKRLIYNKVGDKIDQGRNLRNHIRDTAQPFGATHQLFLEIYGHAALARFYGKEKQSMDAKALAKEDLKVWNRLADRGMSQREFIKERENAHP